MIAIESVAPPSRDFCRRRRQPTRRKLSSGEAGGEVLSTGSTPCDPFHVSAPWPQVNAEARRAYLPTRRAATQSTAAKKVLSTTGQFICLATLVESLTRQRWKTLWAGKIEATASRSTAAASPHPRSGDDRGLLAAKFSCSGGSTPVRQALFNGSLGGLCGAGAVDLTSHLKLEATGPGDRCSPEQLRAML